MSNTKLTTIFLASLFALPVAAASSDALAGNAEGHEPKLGNTEPADADDWWQWALGAPADSNPVLDGTGAHCWVDQGHDRFYLAGTFGGPAERSCEVPAHTKLTFPLVNGFFVNGPGENYELDYMRAVLDEAMDGACNLYVFVDGEELTEDYDALRLVSDEPFDLDLPEGNVFGVAAGSYGPAVADGYYVTVKGLTPGVHTIEFGGAVCDGEQVLFETAVSYELTVD